MLTKTLITRKRSSLFFPAAGVILLLVLGGFEIRWLWAENQGTAVIKTVSGNSEGVLECQRFSDALVDANLAHKGMVFYDQPNVAIIKYSTCQDLFGWFYGDKRKATPEEILAVGVLIHEAYHVGGEFNESTTECLVMKNYVQYATSLGANQIEAERMVAFYTTEIHPRMPAVYKGGTCEEPPGDADNG